MEVGWNDPRCLVCKSEAPFSAEHIIPEALGGRLWARFLCAPCNSGLGEVEGGWKSDPAVRFAFNRLSEQIPELARRLEEGQPYIFDSPLGILDGRLRKGEVTLDSQRLRDGSIVVPSKDGPKKVETMLRREGKDNAEIAEALARLDAATEGQYIQLSDRTAIKKDAAIAPRLKLNSPDVKPLLVIKIAYEFLALHVGSGIFHPSLDRVRDSLRLRDLSPDCCLFEELHASSYGPFHGLLISQREPVVVVVRLFGYLVYRVSFPSVGVPVGTPLAGYTLCLDSGEEDLSPVGDSIGINAVEMRPCPPEEDLPNG
ncbi:MAG: hypothetical protein JSU00_13960 [Acidobacteria bacterium]|nr:hypothetical protein [Acidobacteriota bacterium]